VADLSNFVREKNASLGDLEDRVFGDNYEEWFMIIKMGSRGRIEEVYIGRV
jgi:hypothetical protein